jgi:hypothetical protein
MPEPIYAPVPDELVDFDLSLFGTWEDRAAYGRGVSMEDAALAAEVRAVLEVKSAEALVSPAEQLRQVLNEMTVEMREQFAAFRTLREMAAKLLTDGDEAEQKLARADVKAATDAMSVIVRTLEKVDALQRQLARDREIEAERVADEGGYEAAKARFIQMIEDRANETALGLFEAWKRTGPPDWAVERLGREAAEPADETSGGEGGGGEGNESFHSENTGPR